jgi:AcrR family transcriptional regulator
MSEATRLTLIRIGERLFSKQGYRDVSIEDVVNAAGISAGSFYNYFESKEIFYSEILDFIENQGAKRLEKMIAKLSSPINKLRVVYRFVTLGIKHNPMLRGVLAGEEKYIFPGTEERRIRGNDIRARVQGLIVIILREGSAKGLFRSSVFRNPNVLLTSLYDVILHHIDSEHFDSLLEDILTLLDRGLRRQIQFRNREKRVDRRYFRRSGIDLDEIDLSDMDIDEDS